MVIARDEEIVNSGSDTRTTALFCLSLTPKLRLYSPSLIRLPFNTLEPTPEAWAPIDKLSRSYEPPNASPVHLERCFKRQCVNKPGPWPSQETLPRPPKSPELAGS